MTTHEHGSTPKTDTADHYYRTTATREWARYWSTQPVYPTQYNLILLEYFTHHIHRVWRELDGYVRARTNDTHGITMDAEFCTLADQFLRTNSANLPQAKTTVSVAELLLTRFFQDMKRNYDASIDAIRQTRRLHSSSWRSYNPIVVQTSRSSAVSKDNNNTNGPVSFEHLVKQPDRHKDERAQYLSHIGVHAQQYRVPW